MQQGCISNYVCSVPTRDKALEVISVELCKICGICAYGLLGRHVMRDCLLNSWTVLCGTLANCMNYCGFNLISCSRMMSAGLKSPFPYCSKPHPPPDESAESWWISDVLYDVVYSIWYDHLKSYFELASLWKITEEYIEIVCCPCTFKEQKIYLFVYHKCPCLFFAA